mmetsp:Transcript_5550/g.12773  ORF Transcript_5550/g.12773 Transcript_5550/m.12773 type:complete len:366 (+) Transcript_5550:154-1251(+)
MSLVDALLRRHRVRTKLQLGFVLREHLRHFLERHLATLDILEKILVIERVAVHRTVVHRRGVQFRLRVHPRERVLHPVHIVAIREVFVSVSAARLLARFRGVHDWQSILQKVLKLERLDEIHVPRHAALVGHLHIGKLCVDLVHLLLALRERLRRAVHRRVRLHRLLHFPPNFRGGNRAVGVAQLVQALDRSLAGIRGKRRLRGAGLHQLADAVRARAAENDDVEQAVGAESVRAVHRRARSLSRSHEAWNHVVGVAVLHRHHLAEMVRGDATHVVVHRRQHRDGFLGDVHAGEDRRRLGDAGKTFGKQLRRQVVQVKVDVVLLRTHAAPLADLHRHRSRDDVARREILRRGRVPLHESLTLAVA